MSIDTDFLSPILEKINFKIDEDVRKLISSSKVRNEMLKKYGEKAFLDSKDKKFPVINPKTGSFECTLIYAALMRAIIFSSKNGTKTNPKEYYDKIRENAKKLYEKEKCGDKIKVKLNQEEVDALFLNEVFAITETQSKNINILTDFIE